MIDPFLEITWQNFLELAVYYFIFLQLESSVTKVFFFQIC